MPPELRIQYSTAAVLDLTQSLRTAFRVQLRLAAPDLFRCMDQTRLRLAVGVKVHRAEPHESKHLLAVALAASMLPLGYRESVSWPCPGPYL